jgi:hypothetical protein
LLRGVVFQIRFLEVVWHLADGITRDIRVIDVLLAHVRTLEG